MRPVLGRDRLPEEIAGRRIEGVIEGDEADILREDGAVGSLIFSGSPLKVEVKVTVPSPLSIGPVPMNC